MICPVCNKPDTRAFEKRGYTVHRCPACGYLWVLAPGGPAPAVDYAKLYGETYYGAGEQMPDSISRYDLSSILATKMPQALESLRLIHRFKKTGRLLDVGCSAGVFVKAAREAGFDAQGIDVSAVAVRFAREQLGVNAQVTTLEAADFAGQRFDVITLWDVLEHFEDPRRALGIIDQLLAVDGIVALRTPNTRCLRTMLHGFESWDMVSPPEHYQLFSRHSLARMLEQIGFRLAHLSTVHSDWIYYRQVPAWKKLPFHLSGLMGWGGDLVAVAMRTS